MVHIDSYDFGRIVIDGKVYEKDVIILPSEKIFSRPSPKGTHLICFSELKEILKENPKVIVIGNGKSGVAELEFGIKEKIYSFNIKLLVTETDEAIKIFNKLKEKKAGIFHLTC